MSQVLSNIKNIQELAIEMFRRKSVSAPLMTKNTFMKSNENHYNLRNQKDLRRPIIRPDYDGSETISYLGPKL